MEYPNFYRYELTREEGHAFLRLITFSMIKETPKGNWICFGNPKQLHSKPKWVGKTSVKRYAFPTKEAALVDYITRTQYRIKHLKVNIEDCEFAIFQAKKFLRDIDKELELSK